LIEKLRADKRELQEKVDTLTEELQDYKRLLKENGFDVEEEGREDIRIIPNHTNGLDFHLFAWLRYQSPKNSCLHYSLTRK
jgi:hypothetical protein